MDGVAARIWNAMKENQYLFYIGESYGGCTANDKFFELINEYETEDKWKLKVNFRSFWGIHDQPYLYKRGKP